jgi:hypothetical protein
MGAASSRTLDSELKWISNGYERALYSTQAEDLPVTQLAWIIPAILEYVITVLETKLHWRAFLAILKA